jgi:membrane-bound serine protease (ClpP class)
MNKRSWSYRVLIRYTLLQLPALALLVSTLILLRWVIDIPLWATIVLTLLWIVKDVVMFPFVWRAYDQNSLGHANSMVGLPGVTIEQLSPSGYIQVRGELWRAELEKGHPPIDKGEQIYVRGHRGLTLLVEAPKANR